MEDRKVHGRLLAQTKQEPYARLLDMEVKKIEKGYAVVEMRFNPKMENIFGMAHGGAIYSLLDEAFQTACNSYGTVAVALNVNVTYVHSPEPGILLRAEARELSLTRKTAAYLIRVTDEQDNLIATCQALAYRKGRPIPFF
jgi:acyl-CoA thioesterase